MTARVWDNAFDLLMSVEGGYVNDPKDKGGETKYGISKKSYPNEDIANLTIDRAKKIYKRDYWDRCKCDSIPDCLSVALFDFAVHSGTKLAIKKLQESLGVKSDGIIGNQTIGAANRIPSNRVLNDYFWRRIIYLIKLKDFKTYGSGWGNRLDKVRQYCENLI